MSRSQTGVIIKIVALVLYPFTPIMPNLLWHWIALCSTSLLITGCGSKKTAEAIKTESQKSVALISHSEGYGVGFFIEGSTGVCTLLTSKHMVPDGKEISISTIMSKLPFKPLDIRRANNTDLAVVIFKPLDGNCPFLALRLGDSKDVILTQPIYISSYPGGVAGKVPNQSFYISSVTDKRPPDKDGYALGYKIDAPKGTSGSPVLNDFGEVIAVHGRSYQDSNSLGNDRVDLDLGIPINAYKQDEISKLKELQLPDKLTSIAFDAKQPTSKPTPTIFSRQPDETKPNPTKFPTPTPNTKDDETILIPSPIPSSSPIPKKDDMKPKESEKPVRKEIETELPSRIVLKNHTVTIGDSSFRATIVVEKYIVGEPKVSIISTQVVTDKSDGRKYLVGPGVDKSDLDIEIPFSQMGNYIKFDFNGRTITADLASTKMARIRSGKRIKRSKYRSS